MGSDGRRGVYFAGIKTDSEGQGSIKSDGDAEGQGMNQDAEGQG